MDQKIKLTNTRLYVGTTILIASTVFIFSKVPFVSAHITNFAITGGVLGFSLFRDLHKGTSKRSVYGAFLFWFVLNLVMEFFVRIGDLPLPGVTFTDFNTPDPIDAVFGWIAIVIFGWITLRFCVSVVEQT